MSFKWKVLEAVLKFKWILMAQMRKHLEKKCHMINSLPPDFQTSPIDRMHTSMKSQGDPSRVLKSLRKFV